MKLYEIFDDEDEQNEDDHELALKRTGFYGLAGAGALILAVDTGRFLLAQRSVEVQEPHTWNVWGGAIDRGLSPEQAVRKEIAQECGYHGKLKLIPLYVFKDSKGSGFQYHNFLATVQHEFDPKLNWETEDYEWVEWGDWPHPLHFGLAGVLNDGASVNKIQNVLKKLPH